AHPSVFIDAVRTHPVRSWGQRTTVAVILDQIGDPSSADILCAYVRDRHWLVRLHATRALGRLGDDRSRACIERVIRDDAWMVRAVATQAVAGWDAERAISLYECWLAERSRLLRRTGQLDPVARREIEADLDDLRSGRTIPPVRPWRAGPL
ncbi:MAG TPA: HEAT repeat domain-containing protein, partial [Acidimicrobiales bacterium]|nr:HEAT repeat domain-containing protein [Acidimicrobiales bacterium]